MKARWLGPRTARSGAKTNRCIQGLVECLRVADDGLVVKQLAARSGLPPQTCHIVLHTLRQLGMVTRSFHSEIGLYVWSWKAESPAFARKPIREQKTYSLQEAAKATGLTVKALQRRAERGTLTCIVSERRRFVTHEALQQAGLLDGPYQANRTERAVRQLIRVLAFARPGRTFTTTELIAEASGTTNLNGAWHRQACEASLAALLAVRFVEKAYDPGPQQYAWSWVGPSI